MLGTGFLLIPFVGPGPAAGLLAALGLVVGGQGLASPSLSSLISKTVQAPEHGEVLGVSQSLSAGARVLGPAGGGFVFHHLNADAVYVAAAACAAGAVTITLLGAGAMGETESGPVRVRRPG
jgi:hypothetical protein